MVLIFGGAFQGKVEFALEKFDLGEKDVFNCTDSEDIDYTCKVINNLDRRILGWVKDETEARDELDEVIEILRDKIIIVNDISQGVVPMEKELRAWREMVGRTMLYLSKEADEVYRVFCGIGQQIK